MVERKIVLRFVDEEVSAEARLLWDESPQTCQAIWDLLPLKGYAHHAIYSGSEIALVLPQCIVPPLENGTVDVKPGDVGFTWFRKGSSYGVDTDFAEICWFYDRDAKPSMAEGPVPVTLFAHFDSRRFFSVCRRMRREGIKQVEIVVSDRGTKE